MTGAEIFLEIIKILIPGVLVVIGMTVVMNQQGKRQDARERYEMRAETVSRVVPLRLQAYERAVLFLERISPENLVIRVNASGKQARQFQGELLNDIRAEYEHNMAQQLYITNEAWFELVRAKEQIVSLVNTCANSLPPNAPASDLGRRMIEMLMKSDAAPTHHAILVLKGDVQRMFRI